MKEIMRYDLHTKLYDFYRFRLGHLKVTDYDAVINETIDFLEMTDLVKIQEEILVPEHLDSAVNRIDKDNCGSEAECDTRSYGYEKFCEYQEDKENVMNKLTSTLLNVAIEDVSEKKEG